MNYNKEITNFTKYRGKCKEFVDALCKGKPHLTPVRGFYHCPFGGKQPHWWAETKDGAIVDPTIKQFSSPHGTYERFDGFCECAECGVKTLEADTIFCGRYPVCSTSCQLALVGLT